MWFKDYSEDYVDYYGITPLHTAAEEGDVEKVSDLLSQGVSVDRLTEYEETALHIATSTGTSLEVVKMLVEAGADVNLRDQNEITPLMYACLNGHDSIGSYLVRNGAEVNACNSYGTTPLMLAIRAKSLSVSLISDLLKAEACVNGCERDVETPLHAIIKRLGGFYDTAKWDVLELLLSYPCDINAKQHYDGITPLFTAVWRDDLKSALMLIEAGCKVDIADYLGRTPMSCAIKKKLYPHVELLVASGERIPREDWMDVKRSLESEDPSMLDRLLAAGAECPKLSNVCRRAFYDRYGTQTRNRVDQLPLSSLIKRYLYYEIL